MEPVELPTKNIVGKVWSQDFSFYAANTEGLEDSKRNNVSEVVNARLALEIDQWADYLQRHLDIASILSTLK